MKSIIIYSGKGGVGKTTVTANIGRALAKENKKVFIIDSDINTPSMNVEFNGEHPEDNIWIHSSGNMFDNFIYLEKAMIRQYLSEAKKKIKKIKPDYILIDTPPSVTNVHFELLKVMKISHILFVTQPTALSKTDVKRTADFFKERCGFCPSSIIENMVIEEDDYEPVDYGTNLIARIPFIARFRTNNLLKEAESEFKEIIHIISKSSNVNIELNDITCDNQYDETFDVVDIFRSSSSRNHSYNLELKYDGENQNKTTTLSRLRFISVRTWDTIKSFILEEDVVGTITLDRLIHESTTERISRLLDSFEDSNSNYFMVTRAPHCEIRLITGEIGLGSLSKKSPEKFYGIPTIDYITSKGSVRLFPHEVLPIKLQDMKLFLEDGYVVRSDGRYFPNKETVKTCYEAYGTDVGLTKDWEKIYDDWNTNHN